MVTLSIDGKQVTVPKTATIYEAAKEAGVHIPVLCYHQKLMPFGACRVCLVEVEQMKGRLIPACTTPATEGMNITTTSDEILKVRKTVMEFILVNHVVECPVCDKGGECELQDLTYEMGVNKNRFEGEKFNLPTDEVNPLIERNMNRCVLCGKCVRVCDEVVGYGSYSFINRGFETKIATAYDRGLDCEFCGQCVSVCPVGAILPRPFKFKARPWQLKQEDTVCGYCGNGCTITLGTLDGKVETIRYNDKIGVNNGNLCVRGRFGYSYINSEERLTKPLIRKDGELVEAEWSEAMALFADKVKSATPEKIAILAGGRLTNEEYAGMKSLATTLGTANIDNSGGECYRGVTEGLKDTLGITSSTGTFPQVETADAIFAIRSDLYETHPVLGMTVNQAIRRNDAKLIVLADKKGKLTKLPNTKTLLARPGAEISVINAICNVLLDENIAKIDGVDGVDELKVKLAAFDAETVAKYTGVDAEAIRETARTLAAANKGAILLAYGMPYQSQAKELAVAAANLSMLTGFADQDECGIYLCGEKSNSQGAIDFGVTPGAKGLGAQAMLEAAGNGNIDLLYVVGENPVVSYPDRKKIETALKSKAFVVVQDIFLSETAQQADLVLPAASFAEKDGTFTNAERRIQRVRAGVAKPGAALTDLEIFEKISTKLGTLIKVKTVETAFAELKELNDSYAIDFSEIGPKGAVWGGDFVKPSQKKLVFVEDAAAVTGDYLLLTGSALYHSGTTSTRATGPNAVVSDPYVEFGREDATTLGLKNGDMVKVSAKGETLTAKVKVDTRLAKGVLFAPYHFAALELNKIYAGEAAIAVTVTK